MVDWWIADTDPYLLPWGTSDGETEREIPVGHCEHPELLCVSDKTQAISWSGTTFARLNPADEVYLRLRLDSDTAETVVTYLRVDLSDWFHPRVAVVDRFPEGRTRVGGFFDIIKGGQEPQASGTLQPERDNGQ